MSKHIPAKTPSLVLFCPSCGKTAHPKHTTEEHSAKKYTCPHCGARARIVDNVDTTRPSILLCVPPKLSLDKKIFPPISKNALRFAPPTPNIAFKETFFPPKTHFGEGVVPPPSGKKLDKSLFEKRDC